MRKNLLIGILVLSLGVACGRQEVQTGAEIAVPVSVMDVELGSIEEFVVVTGTVRAVREAQLVSETEGFYHLQRNPRTQKPYALGDLAKKGELIIRLENPELENNIKIESQKLNLDIAKQEYEKQKSLYEKGGVTLRELREAEKALMDAQYNYQYAQLQLGKLEVRAPFDGVIVDLPYYTPGVKVNANQPMVSLMDYHQLILEVNLPGKELGRVRVEQPVRVMNYASSRDTLQGRVTQVSPALDPDTRSFKVTILVDNPEWTLRPGMFVKGEIIVERHEGVVVIPKDIVLSRSRGKVVYVVERGVARERLVQLGLENPDQVEVVRGLAENERVVVKGFETLRDGSQVKIIR
ncbi:MAG: efflux RND transporter periplasmic adaptor subunit [candidate division KSB1 bacterium]|nr:efflux RND transporter periplasmic adaptor subunit [candidate division KSB1 bacterium]